MLKVTFDVHGDQQYVRAFEAFEREMDDLREPLRGTRDILVDSSRQQFETEGSHGLGARWKPLSTEYEIEKFRRWGPRTILIASGAMRDLLLNHGTIELGVKRLVWGIREGVYNRHDKTEIAEYAAVHQKGKGAMPQRQFIKLNTGDRRQIDREFVTFISTRRRALGLK